MKNHKVSRLAAIQEQFMIMRAIKNGVDEERIAALGLAFSGAMVQAGMGHLDYDDVPAQLATVARLVLERTPGPTRPIRPTNARSTS